MAKKNELAPRARRDYRRSGSAPSISVSLAPGIPSVTEGKSPAMDFATALQAGNPAALDQLNKLLPKSKDKDKSLADFFVESTYTFADKFNITARERKMIEPVMRDYRLDMRRAHKFVLDNEFTEAVTIVSTQMTPMKLLARLQYAVLPYETTWVEFDLKSKVRVMRRLHHADDTSFDYSQVAERIGLLMHRITATDSVIEMVTESIDMPGFVSTLICFFFSTTDSKWDASQHGCLPMVYEPIRSWSPAFERESGISKEHYARLMANKDLLSVGAASLWGFSEGTAVGILQSVKDLEKLKLPPVLSKHGVLGYSRCYRLCSQLYAFVGIEALTRILANEVTDFTGMMRWVAVLLAMLSEVPVSSQHVKPEGTIRTGLTSRQSKMDYHRLTLRLPKVNPIKFIERRFHEAARRRAHDVRAHWRTYLHEVHCPSEDHDWVYDHEDGYRLCGKCSAYGRLIKEHVRGDPSLGWVQKEYVIKSSTAKL